VLIVNPGFDIVGSVADGPAPASTRPSALPSPNPDFMNEVRDSLGPVPKDGEMSDEELDAVLVTIADWEWQSVVSQYPDSVRPEVDLIRVVEAHERSAVQVDCLVARGIDARVTSGDSYTYGGGTEEDLLRIFRCAAEYPTRPEPELTPKQVGYLYDYQVKFAVPCLERLGYVQATPPYRADFIASWPEQDWRPDFGAVTDSKTSRAIEEACPTMPTGLF